MTFLILQFKFKDLNIHFISCYCLEQGYTRISFENYLSLIYHLFQFFEVFDYSFIQSYFLKTPQGIKVG